MLIRPCQFNFMLLRPDRPTDYVMYCACTWLSVLAKEFKPPDCWLQMGEYFWRILGGSNNYFCIIITNNLRKTHGNYSLHAMELRHTEIHKFHHCYLGCLLLQNIQVWYISSSYLKYLNATFDFQLWQDL